MILRPPRGTMDLWICSSLFLLVAIVLAVANATTEPQSSLSPSSPSSLYRSLGPPVFARPSQRRHYHCHSLPYSSKDDDSPTPTTTTPPFWDHRGGYLEEDNISSSSSAPESEEVSTQDDDESLSIIAEESFESSEEISIRAQEEEDEAPDATSKAAVVEEEEQEVFYDAVSDLPEDDEGEASESEVVEVQVTEESIIETRAEAEDLTSVTAAAATTALQEEEEEQPVEVVNVEELEVGEEESMDDETSASGDDDVSTSSKASIELASEITKDMQQELVKKLGYKRGEVRDMKSEIASVVLAKQLSRPVEGIPSHWRKEEAAAAAKRSNNMAPVLRKVAISLVSIGTCVFLAKGANELGIVDSVTEWASCILNPPSKEKETLPLPVATALDGHVTDSTSSKGAVGGSAETSAPLPEVDKAGPVAGESPHEHSVRPGEIPPAEPVDETWLDRFITALGKKFGKAKQ